jgi:16S rRNA (cytidine1402-2'-O)-methyltransferase
LFVAPTTPGSTQQMSPNELTEVDSTPRQEQPALYLIPSLLAETPPDYSLPSAVANVVSSLKHFAVEEERSARAFIKAVCPQLQIRDLSIKRIAESPSDAEVAELMTPLFQGYSVGVVSEAGCPGIADPGAHLVSYAHAHNIRVVPLVGPCSMVLALMGSGLNGQAWRFIGYLSVDPAQRTEQIKRLEDRSRKTGETQIFMETPYRNDKLLQDLLTHCAPDTRLCIAQGLTGSTEFIKTLSVSDWRRSSPKLEKVPCIFLVGPQGRPSGRQRVPTIAPSR